MERKVLTDIIHPEGYERASWQHLNTDHDIDKLMRHLFQRSHKRQPNSKQRPENLLTFK